ncbi:GntR family transcriptional regulator [Microbacterium hominis]|uniref:GntR family transcriptional regulator n=1 Tax=Microbacterium hominis TaxID=162426 RepID=UPI0009EC39BE|nr:FCD domain-containing protein [Microbacterium hominis]
MRASDRAYRTLLDEIQSGVLRPGAVLAEVEQSVRLGVTGTPLREALGRPADGAMVLWGATSTPTATAPRRTALAPKATTPSREKQTAARLAASSGATPPFAALATEFAATDAAADPDAYYALIARFDDALDLAVANDYLTAALKTVRTHLVRVRRLARDNPERLAASVAEHRLIASAIGAGDAELAAHATHVHLHNALAAILASLEGTP